jgi:nucleoside-diphosphate-sugar epimerase
LKRISDEDLAHIFHHTEKLCEKLRDKNIFITGATGFFGKWLLESFIYINNKLSLNVTVTALSRNPEDFLNQYPFYGQEKSIRFIKGDVRSFEFTSGNFDFIIHAATDADAALNESNPLLMMDTITIGTRRVLEFARSLPNLESFLFLSSGAVYGKQPPDFSHIKEQDNFFIDINNPTSAYAEAKRMAELYCSTYFEKFGLPVKIARCFAFVGPHLPLDKHFAIGNFILNGLNNEDIVIKGDGSPYRSYMYAADLAIWLWTILINGENNTPYNVGSDVPVSIKETAVAVSAAFNNKVKCIIKGKPTGMPAQRYVPCIDKAMRELGLKLNIEIGESIRRTVYFNN